eukprot:scaffold610576_cov25-Prasinocladus_malaysianus.AAC.1
MLPYHYIYSGRELGVACPWPYDLEVQFNLNHNGYWQRLSSMPQGNHAGRANVCAFMRCRH